MKEVTLIFPHQLFAAAQHLAHGRCVFLVEEFLFFKHYKFHQQKILFHRASMRAYADDIFSQSFTVEYIPATDEHADIRKLIPFLAKEGYSAIHYIDPTDNWLSKRLKAAAHEVAIPLHMYTSPLFMNTPSDNADFFRANKKKFYQTTFYKQQREKYQILIDPRGKPKGGKWTYDTDNRKKYPAKKVPPRVLKVAWTRYHEEAKHYVNTHFSQHIGKLSNDMVFPISREAALAWFEEFLDQRFEHFGDYEDAIVKEEIILHHSLLSPLMNVGLLSADEVIERALAYAAARQVPLNSVEGFIRQIIGWREFIRGVYESVGNIERSTNYWGFERKIPVSFYDGTTGIEPIDCVIKKVLKTGCRQHLILKIQVRSTKWLLWVFWQPVFRASIKFSIGMGQI